MPALFPAFLGDSTFIPLGMDEHVVNLLGHLVRAEQPVHADEADDVPLDIGVDFPGKELVVQMRVVFFGLNAVLGDFLLGGGHFAALLLDVVCQLVGNRFNSRTCIQEGFDTVQDVKVHPVTGIQFLHHFPDAHRLVLEVGIIGTSAFMHPLCSEVGDGNLDQVHPDGILGAGIVIFVGDERYADGEPVVEVGNLVQVVRVGKVEIIRVAPVEIGQFVLCDENRFGNRVPAPAVGEVFPFLLNPVIDTSHEEIELLSHLYGPCCMDGLA